MKTKRIAPLTRILSTAALLGQLFLPLAAQASGAAQPSGADLAVTPTDWTSLEDAVASHHYLIEGSYQGENRNGDGFRLHVINYASRNDAFIALLESTELDVAVLGFIQRSDADDSYLWREISVDADFEGIGPRPTKSPMYRIKPKYTKDQRIESMEVISTLPQQASNVVTLTEARAPLMRNQPLNGTYQYNGSNGSTHTIRLSSNPNHLGTWSLDETIDRDGQAHTQTGIGRYAIPGVMIVRETTQASFESQIAENISTVAVAVSTGENEDEQLILFGVQTKDASTESPGAATKTHPLVRPAIGQHLTLTE